MAMTSDTSIAPARRGPPATKHIDILWAAARLFGQRGVAQTTTRDIAAEAQTTERTLFKHFGNKDGLVQAVIAEAVLTHLAPTSLDALRKAIDAHDDDVERWHVALLQGRSQAMASAPELTRLLLVELLRDEGLRGRFAAQWLPAVWRPLQGLFKRLQREGRLRRDVSAESLARMFLSLNVAYLVSRYTLAPQAHWDDTAEIAAIASLFARGAAPG
jgi:AcrR family transcriptional regulator